MLRTVLVVIVGALTALAFFLTISWESVFGEHVLLVGANGVKWQPRLPDVQEREVGGGGDGEGVDGDGGISVGDGGGVDGVGVRELGATLTVKSWPPSSSHDAFPPPAPTSADEADATAAADIGLVSFCHGPKFEAMGKWATLNHREYARRHGYDFFQGDENILPHMHFLAGRRKRLKRSVGRGNGGDKANTVRIPFSSTVPTCVDSFERRAHSTPYVTRR